MGAHGIPKPAGRSGGHSRARLSLCRSCGGRARRCRARLDRVARRSFAPGAAGDRGNFRQCSGGAAQHRARARRRSIRYFLDCSLPLAGFDRFRSYRLRRYRRCDRSISGCAASAPVGAGCRGHSRGRRPRSAHLAGDQPRRRPAGILDAPHDRTFRFRRGDARGAVVAAELAGCVACRSRRRDRRQPFGLRHGARLDVARKGKPGHARSLRTGACDHCGDERGGRKRRFQAGCAFARFRAVDREPAAARAPQRQFWLA